MTAPVAKATSTTAWMKTEKKNGIQPNYRRKGNKSEYKPTNGKETYNRYPYEQARNTKRLSEIMEKNMC